MIYVFLAEGFEDIEAIAPIDILRRGGVEVALVSIAPEREVTSAHGVRFVADITIGDIDWEQAEALFLPGGLPGAANLDACQPLREGILSHAKAGRLTAAICAAPMVLGHLGLLEGKRATCYPGFEGELKGATVTGALVERDGQVLTGKGPGAAMAFGYALLEALGKTQEAAQLREGMMYNFLLNG